MTVGAAMRSASLRLMGQRPQPMFGSQQLIAAELCDLVNDVAKDVAQYHDWQSLIRTGSLVSDGVIDAFPLPADYDRMLLDSQMMDTQSWGWGYQHFLDINAFWAARDRGFLPVPGGWMLYGNQFQFAPAPPNAQPVTFPYITNNWAVGANGTPKSEFTADDDKFLLPEDLLTLGLIYRWRDNKSLDSTGDLEIFSRALDNYAAKDSGSRVQRRNSRRTFSGVGYAYPGTLG